jgi:Zn-dependent peptidase ImmA (M78 family)/transcriptional regulator with XRE-family HTH domain
MGISDVSIEIGDRIAHARGELGFTQSELAARLALDRTAVAKIESGRRKISATELVRLATILDRPIDWFVTDSPPAVVSRRTDLDVGGKSPLLDRRIERLARDVRFLQTEGVLPHATAPRLDIPSDPHDAEATAERTRKVMDVDASEPLLELHRHAEAVGMLAFSLDLGGDGPDGAYVRANSWGVALVNGTVDPGRRRFNLAHELGHHVFADAYAPEVTISPGSETERVINAFAVHLLLPRSGVEKVWNDFNQPRLAALAIGVRYRASWTAVSSQLKNLGLVDETQRRELCDQLPTSADFIELGERWVSELDPPTVPPEYGRRVLAAYRDGRLTAARTTELLWGTVGEDDLPERRPLPVEGLRREFQPLP